MAGRSGRPCPKPARHKGVGERYEAARGGFLEQRFNASPVRRGDSVVVGCECGETCGRVVTIEREVRGGEGADPGAAVTMFYRYFTSGDVHHLIPRSRRPDLREDPSNIRLMSRVCHRLVKHGGARRGANQPRAARVIVPPKT